MFENVIYSYIMIIKYITSSNDYTVNDFAISLDVSWLYNIDECTYITCFDSNPDCEIYDLLYNLWHL